MPYPYNYEQRKALMDSKHKLEVIKRELERCEKEIAREPSDVGFYQQQFYDFVKKVVGV